MSADGWKRQFPTGDLLAVVDAVADLVAERVADRLSTREPQLERAGFSLREAGAYLGCSASHVSKMVDEGRIKAAHLGGRTIIHRQELDRLMLGEQAAS
jgi:excisionase family DNA binding protein